MVTIHTSNTHQPATLITHKVGEAPGNADRVDNTTTTATIESEPQVSGQAKMLSTLYASASDYVKSEHLQAYSGSVNGNVTVGAYINVGKYNDYVFDKAATAMVAAAKDNGIMLDKADVLAQLKSDHADIASITLDDQDRTSKLGPNNMYADLSTSDLDSLTDIYITAKENGLSLDEVAGLALRKGIQNHYGSTLQAGDIYPYDWDYSETDPDKIAAAKNQLPEAITSKADEIKSKIQGDLGLGSDFIPFLLNPKIGLRGATDASLDFLSKLAALYNQQKPTDA
ncbi:hypothetical protein GCM10009504_08780 [Pseudomonas laurentiana]|nr:hypothetical protein [Pseudomonas laurentiana]GGU54112.1 hypothetical protein GCM10009504_08780 [Pseudomonas laurentiana]